MDEPPPPKPSTTTTTTQVASTSAHSGTLSPAPSPNPPDSLPPSISAAMEEAEQERKRLAAEAREEAKRKREEEQRAAEEARRKLREAEKMAAIKASKPSPVQMFSVILDNFQIFAEEETGKTNNLSEDIVSLTNTQKELENSIASTLADIKKAEDQQLEAAMKEDFETADNLTTKIDTLTSTAASLRTKLSDCAVKASENNARRLVLKKSILSGLSDVQDSLVIFKQEQNLDVNSESNEVSSLRLAQLWIVLSLLSRSNFSADDNTYRRENTFSCARTYNFNIP